MRFLCISRAFVSTEQWRANLEAQNNQAVCSFFRSFLAADDQMTDGTQEVTKLKRGFLGSECTQHMSRALHHTFCFGNIH